MRRLVPQQLVFRRSDAVGRRSVTRSVWRRGHGARARRGRGGGTDHVPAFDRAHRGGGEEDEEVNVIHGDSN